MVQEFIDFANAIVPDSTEDISDLKTGEVWCEVVNVLDGKETIKADEINKGKNLPEIECRENYKALEKEVKYVSSLNYFLDEIIAGNKMANYEVAAWFKQYFEENAKVDILQKVKSGIEDIKEFRSDEFEPAEMEWIIEKCPPVYY